MQSRNGVFSAGCGLPAWQRGTAGRDQHAREGASKAVIVVEVIAAALAVAAIVYLVFALVSPERF